VAHQLLILATGNYGFFNLLTIVLALSLFDDAFWTTVLGRIPGVRRLLVEAEAPGETWPTGFVERLRRPATAAFLVFALGLGGVQLVRSTGLWNPPEAVLSVWRDVAPFQLVNGYGLFATMTEHRPELLLEARRNGGPWRPLDFRWKPDDPSQRPGQAAPYMPRLDWQMWFAALRAEHTPADAAASVRYDRWLLRFVEGLLAGSPRVWALLGSNPRFRGEDGTILAPDEIRIVRYQYRFTSAAEREGTGDWWTRGERSVYLPPVRRTADGRLERVRN